MYRLGIPLVVVSCLCALPACDRQPLAVPALPLTIHDPPGTLPEWTDRGDPTCAFPSEANTAKIASAEVLIRVLVDADGSPKSVQTLKEPGFGFGAAATRCAMAREYEPGRDEFGVAVARWTPPIRLRFVR
ncbi:MAG TPA: energy transducer TonB [Polyangiaceae bacterium]|nr:energy transducer TonB [Polyangiaceae bacterium]